MYNSKTLRGDNQLISNKLKQCMGGIHKSRKKCVQRKAQQNETKKIHHKCSGITEQRNEMIVIF